MVSRKNIHEISFLINLPPEKCNVCHQPIFDFEELPDEWKHKKCSFDYCQETSHLKCYDKHYSSHPKIIRTKKDLENLRKSLGINKNTKVDRCLLCKRNLVLKNQLCLECSNLNKEWTIPH